MSNVTVSERKINQHGGVIILPIEEYRRLCEKAVPIYKCVGKEAEEIDRIVEEGIKEYEAGDTISVGSVGEALKLYGTDVSAKEGISKS